MAKVSGYKPYIYQPRNLSAMNKAAARAAADGIASAADMFAAQMSDMGSQSVTLAIEAASKRIQAEAQKRIAKATEGFSSIDTTV